MGAACRAWARGCFLRPDRQGHRLRAGGGRRADRQGRGEEPALRLRRADQGKGRRDPHRRRRRLGHRRRRSRRPACASHRAKSVSAKKSVICSVTPTQLYGRLLGKAAPGDAVVAATKKYRYGKGNFQIHYALDRPPAWRNEELGKVALLHLTPGLDGVSKACNEAARGMLPETPTICVGQPHALDPSRCRRRQGDPLAAAARGPAPHQGRRRRQARNPGRRQVDRCVARSLCRPRRGDPRQPYRRLLPRACLAAAHTLPPISKR